MKIAYICHYFTPEPGAPSARLHDLSKVWVENGHEVKVVTAFPNHPSGIIPDKYRGYRLMSETIDGIQVFRSWVYATPNEGFIKKTLGHISFMISSVLFTLPRLGKVDVIIVSSPTFFSVISAYIFSKITRKPYVFEIRDLWPEAIVKLGVLKNKPIINLLEWIESFLYRNARKIVVVTKSFKETLVSRGIPDAKVEVITNGVDTEFYQCDDVGRNEIRKQYDLENKFVVSYIGTHGISHALDKIVDVAERLRAVRDIHFLFVGGGAAKKDLEAKASALGLSNITFLPIQAKDLISSFYSASDVSLVPLKKLELFKGFIPSKMFEIMSCGCPIIASVEGESEHILRDAKAAIIIEPENVGQLEEAILKLKNEPDKKLELGRNGRNFVERYFSRKALGEKYLSILRNLM